MWDPYADFEKVTFDNGLNVYIAQWPERELEYVGVIVHSGANCDFEGMAGLAHFVEHLVSSNIKMDNASHEELDAFFENNGGWISFGRTSYFHTRYSFLAPIKSLQRSFAIFEAMLLNVSIKKDFDVEQKTVCTEMNGRLQPQLFRDVNVRKRNALYQNTFLADIETAGGTEDSIKYITQADVQKFCDTYYVPQNMSIVCVGGASVQRVTEMLKKTAFTQQHTAFQRQEIVTLPVEPLLQRGETVDLATFGVKQTTFYSISKLPNLHNESVCTILMEMLRKIFFAELRKRQRLTYGISVKTTNLLFFREVIITGGVENGCEDRVSKSIIDIIDTLNEFEELFFQIRNNEIMSKKMYDTSCVNVFKSAIFDIVEQGRIVSLRSIMNNLTDVTFEDVLHLASFLKPEFRYELIYTP